MVQSQKLVVPIICENALCQNSGKLVNRVYGINTSEIDLFYENYDGSIEEDYCPICGELGIAEDPIMLRF